MNDLTPAPLTTVINGLTINPYLHPTQTRFFLITIVHEVQRMEAELRQVRQDVEYHRHMLTDEQVLTIIQHCEEKYGYKPHDHQRVIVEHIRDERQHFHVMWNRVSLDTGKAIWPGLHWRKSKEAAREMEAELGLKRPTPKRTGLSHTKSKHHAQRKAGIGSGKGVSPTVKKQRNKQTPKNTGTSRSIKTTTVKTALNTTKTLEPVKSRKRSLNDAPVPPFNRMDAERATLIAWAWEHGRTDILAMYGIYVSAEVLILNYFKNYRPSGL